MSTVEQGYLLAMGILVFVAIATVLFLEWNARGKKDKRVKQ
jgi:hypothetical protein